jgi:hypothetical protein
VAFIKAAEGDVRTIPAAAGSVVLALSADARYLLTGPPDQLLQLETTFIPDGTAPIVVTKTFSLR